MKYISTSGKECTPAQYLAEMACIKEGKKRGITLSGKFWNDPEWMKKYKGQITAANALLKIYHPDAIIIAFKNHWSYSLRVSDLVPKIKEQEKKLQHKKKQIEKYMPIYENDDSYRSSSYGNKSKLERLK